MVAAGRYEDPLGRRWSGPPPKTATPTPFLGRQSAKLLATFCARVTCDAGGDTVQGGGGVLGDRRDQRLAAAAAAWFRRARAKRDAEDNQEEDEGGFGAFVCHISNGVGLVG